MSMAVESGDRPAIQIAGARTHNLKDISLAIPRDRFVVVTGPSGSGKSSLVFDTLHAEGQRRYLETLTLGRRSMIGQLDRPDVDAIRGLPPTLAIRQNAGSPRPRSTLATITEIAEYLRLLYARAGRAHSPHGGGPLERQSLDEIVAAVSGYSERTKAMILAPLVRGKRGEHRNVFERIAKEGFVRARLDGTIVDTAEPPELDRHRPHEIEAVVDRVIIKPGLGSRLRESIEAALALGDGCCVVSRQEGNQWRDKLFSEEYVCPKTGESFPPLEPRSFSFNNPYGACPRCHGLGVVAEDDTDASSGGPPVTDKTTRRTRSLTPEIICPDCLGERLAPFSRQVRVAGMRLPEFLAHTIEQALRWCQELVDRLARDDESLGFTSTGRLAADKLLGELLPRLGYLERVGLGYLTLDRPARSLSGGEFQRARLAGAIGAGRAGVCYVLDEPTIGLHPRDTERLVGILRDLRDSGNSLVVVEHHLDVIDAADLLVEIGPGAGQEGGRLVAAGSPSEIASLPNTPTGPFLAERSHGNGSLPQTPRRAVEDESPRLRLRQLMRHNLSAIDVDIPLERFVAVTGVSGSGKSTLVADLLVPLVREALGVERRLPPAAGSLASNSDLPERLVLVDQSPLGRTGRSVPATYCGLWREIRRLYAATSDAKRLGYRAKRFSFTSPEGRCAECSGAGEITLSMSFLPELTMPCPACGGKRFNRQTLGVRYRGKSVADVLALRADEAADFFAGIARIRERLDLLREVGLGYLTLGQSALTLSGGEAQRVRLASELSLPGRLGVPPTLFVLDEPTTGLHPIDVRRLVDLLQRLVDDGHSVIAIEHDTDVIAVADWVIDLGPEGGADGGRIVAAGTPGDVARTASSHTGRALAGHGGG